MAKKKNTKRATTKGIPMPKKIPMVDTCKATGKGMMNQT